MHSNVVGAIVVYGFPGPDAPATVDGQIVVKPFKLRLAQGGVEVRMVNFAFSPADLIVLVGTKVTWVNNDGVTHTTTSDTGVWDSGFLSRGDAFRFTFGESGVYPYHYTLHGAPGDVGMSGTIVVIS